jgi:hypothetical protein
MRITSGGDVGIGTSSPSYPLDIGTSQSAETIARVLNSSTNASAASVFRVQNSASNLDVAIRSTGASAFNALDAGSAYFGYNGTTSLVLYASNASAVIKFATNATERARIDTSGNFLVGTTTVLDVAMVTTVAPASRRGISAKTVTSAYGVLQLWNADTTGNNAIADFYTDGSQTLRGNITYNRTAGLTAYNTTSDYRAKDIIGPVTDSGALIDSTPVYMGKMKGATQERPMFIAHETPAYAHIGVKDAVDADGNPVYQQMDASALIPVMWAEIQSLRQRLSAANL